MNFGEHKCQCKLSLYNICCCLTMLWSNTKTCIWQLDRKNTGNCWDECSRIVLLPTKEGRCYNFNNQETMSHMGTEISMEWNIERGMEWNKQNAWPFTKKSLQYSPNVLLGSDALLGALRTTELDRYQGFSCWHPKKLGLAAMLACPSKYLINL